MFHLGFIFLHINMTHSLKWVGWGFIRLPLILLGRVGSLISFLHCHFPFLCLRFARFLCRLICRLQTVLWFGGALGIVVRVRLYMLNLLPLGVNGYFKLNTYSHNQIKIVKFIIVFSYVTYHWHKMIIVTFIITIFKHFFIKTIVNQFY